MQILASFTLPFFKERYKTDYVTDMNCYTKGMLGQSFIIDSISDILLTFTDGKCSNVVELRNKYFPIYRHNCDIWGFLMATLPHSIPCLLQNPPRGISTIWAAPMKWSPRLKSLFPQATTDRCGRGAQSRCDGRSRTYRRSGPAGRHLGTARLPV